MSDPHLPSTDESPVELPPADAPARNRLEYDGVRRPLAKIVLSIALLTLATLGVYRFWGKTRVRRYLWSRVSFLGDRVEYTGTGRELLLGFVAAIIVLALLAGALFGIQLAIDSGHPYFVAVQSVAQITYFIVILFLVYVAQFRARRYRLSRTEWRGIRLAQDGSSWRYALLAFGWGAVTVLSLGTAYTVYRMRLQRYRTTHTSFGNRRFEFEGRAAELLKPWLLAWVFYLPTFGLTNVWYRVREFRYLAGKTRCGSLSFHSGLRTDSVILTIVVYVLLSLLAIALLLGTLVVVALVMILPEMMAGNQGGGGNRINIGGTDLVIYVVAFALYFPVVGVLRMLFLVHPLFHEILGSVTVIGDEDYAAIAQSSQSTPRQGEGLADALDVGAV